MIMKKIFVVSLLFLVLAGCDDDDQGAALIGVWIGDFRDVTLCDNDPTAAQTFSLRCNASTCYRLTLNGDGSYTYQQGTLVENGTYTGDFTVLTLCMDEEGETECTTYTVEGNTSATLDISMTDATTGCKTTFFFSKDTSSDDSGS